jgi:hypothetical protein
VKNSLDLRLRPLKRQTIETKSSFFLQVFIFSLIVLRAKMIEITLNGHKIKFFKLYIFEKIQSLQYEKCGKTAK